MSQTQTGFWMNITALVFFGLGFIFGVSALLEVKKDSLSHIDEGFASSVFGILAILCFAFGFALITRLQLRGF